MYVFEWKRKICTGIKLTKHPKDIFTYKVFFVCVCVHVCVCIGKLLIQTKSELVNEFSLLVGGDWLWKAGKVIS